MNEVEAEKRTTECLNLRGEIHTTFSARLNSGNYINGENLETTGSFMKVTLWINNGTGLIPLSQNDIAGPNIRYIMRFQEVGSPADPIRIGVDNCHNYAHLDVPGIENGIHIDLVSNPTISAVGSVATGLTLHDDEIRDLFKSYFLGQV